MTAESSFSYWQARGPKGEPLILRRQLGGVTEIWDGQQKSWKNVSGDPAGRAFYEGDLDYAPISEDEARHLTPSV